MDITKSSNPVFGKNIFNQSAISAEDGVMTVNGTINKTGLMLLIVIFAATGGIALVYLVSFIAGMFGANLGFMYGNGLMGIGFSLFVVVIAALNLILDFDMITSGANAMAPKYMEWYGAFGLMVTLIWLYLEMLRLLSKLSSRN